MNVLTLLSRLEELEISIQLVNDDLKVNAPKGRLTKDLVDELKVNKKELVEFLQTHVGERLDYTTIEPVEEKEYYVLSPAQKRLYIVQQMEANNISYNMPYILPLKDAIDTEKLEGIFKALISRHESLRTRFITIDGEPFQRIDAEVELVIGHWSLVNGEEESIEAILKDFVRPFDLSRAPLLRVGIVKLLHTPTALRAHPSQEGKEDKYLLLLDMHHIVTDGTSQNILIEEFRQLYNGNPLPAPVFRYRDYCQWLHRAQQQERIKQQEKYWLRVFSNEWPVLNLPLDFPRPERQSFEGSSVCFTIAPEQTQHLKEIAKESGATLYMILLAIVNILLSKLSGAEDIIVGTPIAARRHPSLQNIIGMFVNTLVMRNFPYSTKTFKRFLKDVKKQTPKAYENQDYPFEYLVDQLLTHRDTSRGPLFDVMLVLTDIPDVPHKTAEEKNDNLKEKSYRFESKTAKFDLTLEVLARDEGLHINFEYCTRLFKHRTIERYAGYFLQTVASVIENPGRKLASIEILPAEEKNRILHRFNYTDTSYPKDKLIHELFEEQAGKTPGHTALIGPESRVPNPGPRTGRETSGQVDTFGGLHLSYEELNRKSHRLAAVLRDKGVKPGAIVAIMMERSVEMVMSLLGILKTGGAYLPIDPEYPQERINFILKDSGARVLVTAETFSPEFYTSYKSYESYIPPATTLAYIIYTSGTTGSPKGVLIEHRNIVRLMFNDKFFFDFNGTDVWTMFHSYCFDFSVWEMYGALLYGGRLLAISKIAARDTGMYLDLLKQEQVTVLNQTPSAFYNLMDLELESIDKILHLRYVILGGEALQPGRLKGFKAKYPTARLINMYGITETTVHATFKEIGNREIESNISNIGKPIPTLKAYVIDKHSNLQPIGIAGELCVAGDGVGRGYLNRPELTAEKFLPSSYRSYMSYIYQSGDLARWLSNGDLEYLGRIDHQVKIRGYRIELGEIENRLLRHPKIKEAVVLATPGETGHKHLCAYIVPASQVNTAELREHLLQYLPAYMLPSFFLLLDRLPLTPNGKVDTKALPGPGVITGKEYIAPQTREEMKFAQIWSEVLEIEEERISIDDNFFEIGGHSLKATVMTAKVYKELQVKLPLAEVFLKPTIKGLASYIANAARLEYTSIKAVEKKEYYPLSSAQERMFFLNRLEPGSTVYNLPQLVRWEGKLEARKLQEAFTGLIKRHESLRTFIHMLNGEPVQRINDEVEFEIEYYLATEDTENTAEAHHSSFSIHHSFIRPFNLSQAPLLRVGLTKIEAGKHILMVDMHHITCDGISHEILVKDFTSLMAGKSLSPLRLQYKDYSQWRRGNKEKDFIKQQETYWLNEFNTLPEIPLPDLSTDFARPGIQGFEGKSLEFSLEREQTRALNKLARDHGLTLYMLFLSLFYIFLYKITGQEDIIVGTPTAGRQHADLEQIIGMFINTLALRNFPAGEKTVPGFFREVKARTLEAFENQDYSFAELVETVIKNRDVGRNPLFDVMFTLQNAGPRGIEIPGMKLTPYSYETGIAKFDLALYGSETPDKLLFSFEYSTNLFKKKTIERYATYFKTLISSILTSPDCALGEIEIMPAEEKQRILYDFNKTGTSTPPGKTLHRRIEEQVEKTPDSTALQGPKLYTPGPGAEEKTAKGLRGQITYRQLNEQADRLACLLKERGVGNDNIAALMVERSIEMIIGLLGILKAGAAYLPIDPENPKERIDFMLKDSSAKILLTTKNIAKVINFDKEMIYMEPSSPPASLNLSEGRLFNSHHSSFITHHSKSLAYIIYTSGSTGKPKGVLVEHGNVTAYLHAFYKEFNITSKDTVVQLASFSFDAFGEEVFPILARGGKIFIPTRTEMMDINLLCRLIAKHRVSIIDCTPLLLNEFNKVDRENRENLLESVRLFISGGDILKGGFVDRLLTMGEVYNTYGPTETTICAAYYRLPVSCAGHVPGIPIGKPIYNYGVYILEAGYRPVPIGIRGEICIAGPGLARGYLNNPELTCEKFKIINYKLKIKNKNKKVPGKVLSPGIHASMQSCSHETMQSPPHHSPQHPITPLPHSPIYRTGDLARWLPEGNIEFLGRIDHQVKIRGFRVELEEIEKQLLNHKEVKEAVVLLKEDRNNRGSDSGDSKYLCAYIVTGNSSFDPTALREYLSGRLPYYMVPTYFIRLEKIPSTPGNKIHRQKLLQYKESHLKPGETGAAPGTRPEKIIAEAWQEVLGSDQPGIHDNFFEIGGNSINILKVHDKLKKVLDMDIPVVKLFQYPTIHSLGLYLEGERGAQESPGSELKLPGPIAAGKEMLRQRTGGGEGRTGMEIAVIGMAGIFPGAKDINEFWDNLVNGVESIAFFSAEELGEVGDAPALHEDINYVKAMGVVEGAEYFDAAFFGYTPREAQIMDPQVRIFHQCIWTALEAAAYNPFSYDYRIGLYAGASPNISWEGLIYFSGENKYLGGFQASQLTDKDFMCTRISYKLNLRGPSFNIQTACSTSLVAIHLAVQGLLNGECEMALAGGVTISYPLKSGYNYREGMVMSPDGHCRAFDAASRGMVGGNGAAVVVLKRLENAPRDKDHIYAVIKGSAVNNDGYHKVGYTAPSVPGQAEVILAAQYLANIEPETITYIETHGTGTELGDPVEIEALKLAFGTNKKGGKTRPIKKTCGIGSVKTNVGHLDCAAGAAGFIKTVLALKHHLIPPTLNFNTPNPKLGLEDSPFYVVSGLRQWKTKGYPRRAGVSSLGIGGTNVHVILEEWPTAHSAKRKAQSQENSQGRGEVFSPGTAKEYQLILLSAKTPAALEQMTQNLARYFKENPGVNLSDAAYTLQVGRRHFQCRRMLPCQSSSPARAAELLAKDNKQVKTFYSKVEDPPVIFLLAGQGSQYVDMGKDLYHGQPVFREEMDRCFEILKPLMGYDIKEILYPGNAPRETRNQPGETSYKKTPATSATSTVNITPPDIDRTEITQPLVFAFEYALASLLLHWGIKPGAMIGYSLGEYIAACLSGVFSLEDALKVIVLRGQLMKKTAAAVMLSVPLPEEEIKPLLANHLDISQAIINGPTSIVAGTAEAVKAFEKNMKEKRLLCVPINLAHAVHSPLMEPIRQEFEKGINDIKMNKPRIPYISNISADWISREEAVNPGYWGKHLCTAVRFSDGIKTLLKEKHAVFIEIGPGRLLSNIVRHHGPPDEKTGPRTVPTVKHQQEKISDNRFLLNRLGELWLYGVNIDWPGFYGEEKPSRLSLPTYPFERTRYWIEESFFRQMVGRQAPGGEPPVITAVENPAPLPELPRESGGFPGYEDEEYTAPRDEVEQSIARVWQQYLGFERIGIHANFFKINGDSLTAAQLITRLQQIYPVEISIQKFFEEPTIAKLAEMIKELLIEKVKSLSEEDIDRLM